MFTGIVEAMGEVVAVETQPDGARLHLRVPREFSDLAPGQSLAVNGVCLTVVALEDGGGLFDLAAGAPRRAALRRGPAPAHAGRDDGGAEGSWRPGERRGGYPGQVSGAPAGGRAGDGRRYQRRGGGTMSAFANIPAGSGESRRG